MGQNSEPNLDRGTGKPNRAHEQPEAVLLSRKHRLYGRAHLGADPVSLALRWSRIESWSASEVDLGDDPIPGHMDSSKNLALWSNS